MRYLGNTSARHHSKFMTSLVLMHFWERGKKIKGLSQALLAVPVHWELTACPSLYIDSIQVMKKRRSNSALSGLTSLWFATPEQIITWMKNKLVLNDICLVTYVPYTIRSDTGSETNASTDMTCRAIYHYHWGSTELAICSEFAVR